LYLPNLDADQLHHFKITSQDADDESASTMDLNFTTQQLISLVSDDFNTCTLDPEWRFINPLEDGVLELNGIQAKISVPAGVDHDIWPDPDLPTIRAPHLLRPVTDPNNLKVKFDSALELDRQLQGLLVKQDDQNFLRINYQYQDGKVKLYAIGFSSVSSPVIFKSLTLNGYDPDEPLYLLLNREDGQWQVSYSTDNLDWSETGSFAFPLSVTQAGVFAGNFNKTAGNEPPLTAVLDYYFDADDPIDPEDADPLHLPVNIIGSGSVSKDPTCGSPVTLRAEADPGWRFRQWQGVDVDGLTRLEVTTEFAAGDEVTAVFEVGEPEKYTLDIQTNGQGVVVKDPEQSEYIAGEVVELTAEPAVGWKFDSWGGDISGSDPVTSFEMDSDKAVIANFSQAQLNLDVTIEGPGQVQVSPPGPYDFGQQVTLTAVPAVGSQALFGGWSGDVTSNDNPLIIEITEDMSVTATFITYKQFLPIAIKPSG
jgi:regulation of enolase protein 1 (concanavalin A-like superfamily)